MKPSLANKGEQDMEKKSREETGRTENTGENEAIGQQGGARHGEEERSGGVRQEKRKGILAIWWEGQCGRHARSPSPDRDEQQKAQLNHPWPTIGDKTKEESRAEE